MGLETHELLLTFILTGLFVGVGMRSLRLPIGPFARTLAAMVLGAIAFAIIYIIWVHLSTAPAPGVEALAWGSLPPAPG